MENGVYSDSVRANEHLHHDTRPITPTCPSLIENGQGGSLRFIYSRKYLNARSAVDKWWMCGVWLLTLCSIVDQPRAPNALILPRSKDERSYDNLGRAIWSWKVL